MINKIDWMIEAALSSVNYLFSVFEDVLMKFRQTDTKTLFMRTFIAQY